jgi:hypothetical protein
MNYRDIQNQVLINVGRTSATADGDITTFVKNSINNTMNDMVSRADFRFMRREVDFITIDDYAVGTIAVTNGSATVTGTGTVWTAEFVGRKFRRNGDEIVYQIASRSSDTSITLDRTYQGVTGSSLNYTIYQDRYKLPLHFDKIISVVERNRGRFLTELTTPNFADFQPDPETFDQPYSFYIFGREKLTYTTGTVTVTNDSRTVTGSGTVWDIDDHTRRVFNVNGTNESYTVETVDSSTQVTLDRVYERATAAAQNYTMVGLYQNINLFPIPDDVYEIELRGQITPDMLSRNTDIPDIPRKYHNVIVDGSTAEILSRFEKPNAVFYESRYERGISVMIQDNYVSRTRLDQMGRHRENSRADVNQFNVNWNSLT